MKAFFLCLFLWHGCFCPTIWASRLQYLRQVVKQSEAPLRWQHRMVRLKRLLASHPDLSFLQKEVDELIQQLNKRLGHLPELMGNVGQVDFVQVEENECIQVADIENENWLWPIQGWISAGTWAYPNGQLHLGLDIASPMYTPVLAPANGTILFVNQLDHDDGGYIGNWEGKPRGGGNTILMICQVKQVWYACLFCHLSSRIQVTSGQQVSQGSCIGYTGNTGNSSGPHTHIELFRLKSKQKAIAGFQATGDASFGNGYLKPATCSALACRLRPEEVWGS